MSSATRDCTHQVYLARATTECSIGQQQIYTEFLIRHHSLGSSASYLLPPRKGPNFLLTITDTLDIEFLSLGPISPQISIHGFIECFLYSWYSTPHCLWSRSSQQIKTSNTHSLVIPCPPSLWNRWHDTTVELAFEDLVTMLERCSTGLGSGKILQ